MIERKRAKLNQLPRLLPPGLVATTAWLEEHEYPRSLLSYYVSRGWLESPARGVYRVAGPPPKWQAILASLQLMQMSTFEHVGGRTAIVQRGLGHYARLSGAETICLYGPGVLPHWVNKLGVPETFEQRSDAAFHTLRVYRDEKRVLRSFADQKSVSPAALGEFGLVEIKWGNWDWPLILSSEERAILEVLQYVPERESIYEAYVLLQGLVNLRPEMVSALLRACGSIKAKRLFLALSARHGHAWFKYLDLNGVHLGEGKRALFPGGKLDSKYQITLPADLDEHAR